MADSYSDGITICLDYTATVHMSLRRLLHDTKKSRIIHLDCVTVEGPGQILSKVPLKVDRWQVLKLQSCTVARSSPSIRKGKANTMLIRPVLQTGDYLGRSVSGTASHMPKDAKFPREQECNQTWTIRRGSRPSQVAL